jgi:hypothetical protein
VVCLRGHYNISPDSILMKNFTELDFSEATFYQQSDTWAYNDALIRSADTSKVLYGCTVKAGRIVGYRDELSPTIAVHGICMKNVNDFILDGGRFYDLSGHAYGFVPVSTEYSQYVVVRNDPIAKRCGSEWVDIVGGFYQSLATNYNEHKPSMRFEQVRLFKYSGIMDSGLGDNTHFKNCEDGSLIGAISVDSRMGGLFYETARRVMCTGSISVRSGSRGFTLESDSENCVASATNVTLSGRENLWVNGSKRNLFVGLSLPYGGNLKMPSNNNADCNVNISATNAPFPDGSGNMVALSTLNTDINYASAGIRVQADAGVVGTILAYPQIAGTMTTIVNAQATSVILRARSAGHFVPLAQSAPADADINNNEGQEYYSGTTRKMKWKNNAGTVTDTTLG